MDLRISVLLFIQRAMWDFVTPNLRGVAMLVRDADIVVRFLFENDPGEEDQENVWEMETLVIADFWENLSITAEIDWVPLLQLRMLKLE